MTTETLLEPGELVLTPSHKNRSSIARFEPKPILWNLIVSRYNRQARRIFISCPEGLVPVKTISQRYKLFKKKRRCVKCGRVGTIMSLEKHEHKHKTTYHFELFCIEDEKAILMTKDHVVPKSKGGKNQMTNYQTMCQPCNEKKADIVEELKCQKQ